MDFKDRRSTGDEVLAMLYQEGNRKAGDELRRRYIPLVKSLCRERFTQRFREDLEQELWLAFFEAAARYVPEKSKFSTMVHKALYFKRRHMFERMQVQWNREVMDGTGLHAGKMTCEVQYPGLEWEEAIEIIRRCSLSKKQEDALMWMMDGVLNGAELGRKLGISQQSAYRLMKRIREKAKEVLSEKV